MCARIGSALALLCLRFMSACNWVACVCELCYARACSTRPEVSAQAAAAQQLTGSQLMALSVWGHSVCPKQYRHCYHQNLSKVKQDCVWRKKIISERKSPIVQWFLARIEKFSAILIKKFIEKIVIFLLKLKGKTTTNLIQCIFGALFWIFKGMLY